MKYQIYWRAASYITGAFQREVCERAGRLTNRPILDVPRDTDHLELVSAHREPLADRALGGPEQLRQVLADHCAVAVSRGQIAASYDWDAKQTEKPGRDRVVADPHRVGAGPQHEWRLIAARAERRVDRDRDRFRRRNCTHSFEQRLIE